MTLSLRSRLLLGIIAAVATLLTIFSLTVYIITSRNMIQNFDDSLLGTARMLSAVIEIEQDEDDEHDHDDKHDDDDEHELKGIRIIQPGQKSELDFELDVRMTPEFNNINGGAYFQIWDIKGQMLVRSPSLGKNNLQRFPNQTQSPQYQRCLLPDGKPGRTVIYQFQPRCDKDNKHENMSKEIILTLAVALDASEIYNHLHFFKWLLIIASGFITLISLAIAMMVTRTGLKPIHTLADNISSINANNLKGSTLADDYPRELMPVIDCLNNLLERLEESFDRERRFNADVAHELRTPVAGLQSIIEVCLSRLRHPHEYQESMNNCLDIVKNMNRMVDALLSLARLNTNGIPLKQEQVPVKQIIDTCWTQFHNKAAGRNITFENNISDNLRCTTDAGYFTMIIINILDNAVEYTDQNGRIWSTAQVVSGKFTISISNTGCKLSQDDLREIFDPFWRNDTSRTQTGQHCGIGLSIVQKVVTQLQGAIKAQIGPENIFTIHLTLPRGVK